MTEPTRRRATKKAAPAVATSPPKPPATTSTPAPISTGQMRHLHGLLRSRLGLHDREDVLDWLTLALAREVSTRRDLTSSEAEQAFALLEPLPPMGPGSEEFAALRAPFPAEAIGRLPRSTCRACSKSERKRCDQHGWVSNCDLCNGRHSTATMHIDYVGHADVTARLLAVDPYWTWEPMGFDPGGNPMLDRSGGLWIRLTVLGVTRPGYGDSENGKGMKEAIGDALRNAAMRFGVALDLWAKGDREWARAEKDGGTETHMDAAPPVQPVAPAQWDGPGQDASLARIVAAAKRIDMDAMQVTAKWRDAHGGIPVEGLLTADPQEVWLLAGQVEAYIDTIVTQREADAAAAKEHEAATSETPAAVDPWA